MSTISSKPQHPTYSDADFAQLVEDFSLPADQLEEIKSHLEDAVLIWRHYGGSGEKKATPSEERTALNYFAGLAEKLIESYKKLPFAANRSLGATFFSAQTAASIGAAAVNDPLHEVLRFPTENEDETYLQFECDEIVQLLGALGTAATTVAEAKGPGQVGTLRDHALRMWIGNMARLWENTVQRAFTRDATDRNDPVSEAARFCVVAFNYVDPTMPNSRILNAMKQEIQGKSLSRKNAGKLNLRNVR